MIWAIGQCVLGLIVLWLASEALVEFSSRLGRRLRISSFIVGFVLVGIGTSIPELTVSSLAAAQSDLELAVGNIVGSNVANLSLALGLAALFSSGLKLDNPGLIRLAAISVVSVGAFAVLVQGHFSRYEGIILLALLIPIFWFLFHLARSNMMPENLSHATADEDTPLFFMKTKGPLSLWQILVGIAAGLLGTIAGAQFLVWGTKNLADEISVETGFLGLTLVALGTSAPEIIVGIRSALKGETGILAGNLLGSNISNSLLVGGMAALLGANTVTDGNLTTLAVPIMIGISVLGAAFMIIGKNITRLEAIILILLWIAILPLVV